MLVSARPLVSLAGTSHSSRPAHRLTLKWYSPFSSLLIVTGNRLETTISLCSFPSAPMPLRLGEDAPFLELSDEVDGIVVVDSVCGDGCASL